MGTRRCTHGIGTMGVHRHPRSGAFTHKAETNASSDTEFLAIVRVSLGIVACLIAAGQHWVTGTTGPEFVVIAMASLLLEAARPQKG